MSIEREFLRRSWQRAANSEQGGRFEGVPVENEDDIETQEAVRAYREIKSIAEYSDLELIKGHFISFQKTLCRYVASMRRLSLARQNREEAGADEVEELDKARWTAHNALIDDINILSRYAKKEGLDISWRNMIGNEREQVTDWAERVFKEVENDIRSNLGSG